MNHPKLTLAFVRTLGVGGMATVRLARLHQNGRSRLVAVKTPHPYLARDPTVRATLEDECALGARIDHPNVVRVFGLRRVTPAAADGPDSHDLPSLIMQWIDGVDLATLLRGRPGRARALPPDVAATIVRDLLAGLHAAHEARGGDGQMLEIVHRDVSPQNVIVAFDGMTRITDFGIAKAAWRNVHTETGVVKGKLGYLAPEQLAGRADRRSDVFGAGALLWELLTGARLRKGAGVEMLVEIMNGYAEPPSALAPKAAPLDGAVSRALSREPEDRFATADEMREALERAMPIAPRARVARAVRELARAQPGERSVAMEMAASEDDDEVTEQNTLRVAEQPTEPALASSGVRPCLPSLLALRRLSA